MTKDPVLWGPVLAGTEDLALISCPPPATAGTLESILCSGLCL